MDNTTSCACAQPPCAAAYRRRAWASLSHPTAGGGYGTYFLALLLQALCALLGLGLLIGLFGAAALGVSAVVTAQGATGPTPLAFAVSLAGATMLVLGILYLVGFCAWGQRAMALAQVRGGLRVGHAFSGYGNGWRMVGLILWQQSFVFLWLLLFIVPGIRAAFSYALAPYLLIDHPTWTARQCLAESKRLMAGHRWRYFCLNVSFIGWVLLACLAAHVIGFFAGYLLEPYMSAACALFYEDRLDADAPPAENI